MAFTVAETEWADGASKIDGFQIIQSKSYSLIAMGL